MGLQIYPLPEHNTTPHPGLNPGSLRSWAGLVLAAAGSLPARRSRLLRALPGTEGAVCQGRATVWRLGSGDKHKNESFAFFFSLERKGDCLLLEAMNLTGSRHSSTRWVVQYLCLLAMCLCHLAPCSHLATRTESSRLQRHSNREQIPGLFPVCERFHVSFCMKGWVNSSLL